MERKLTSLLYITLLCALFSGCSYMDFLNTPEDKSESKTDPENGIVKKYNADGKLYAEIGMKDGKKHGVSKNYHKNGKLHIEINYQQGVKEGVAKVYYEDGTLFRETFYEADRKSDIQKIYRPDGKLMAEVPYKDDVPGIGLKEYLMNGKPKTKFPEIVVKTENNLLKNNTYLVFISLSERYKNQEFYVGQLSEGKYLTGGDFVRLIPKNGVVQLTYTVAPGSFYMEQLNFICKSTTKLGNPYITQKTFNLSIENIPF